MSIKNTLLLVALLAILVAGAYVIRSGMKSVTPPRQESSGIANPASTNCIAIGGTLELVESAEGQTGYCHLNDGRVCEEWALFRDGTCTLPR